LHLNPVKRDGAMFGVCNNFAIDATYIRFWGLADEARALAIERAQHGFPPAREVVSANGRNDGLKCIGSKDFADSPTSKPSFPRRREPITRML
jgi:hypothetical protein